MSIIRYQKTGVPGSYVEQYVQARSEIVSSLNEKKKLQEEYDYAKSKFIKTFQIENTENPMSELGELAKAFEDAVEDYGNNIARFGGAFGMWNYSAVTDSVIKIRSGKLSPTEIEKHRKKFENFMYQFLKIIADSTPIESIGGTLIENSKEYSSTEKQQILANIDKVSSWLEGDTQAAATALTNAKTNLVSLAQRLNGEVGDFAWTGAKTIPIDKKSPGSIYGSIFRTLMNIKGGIAERVMALAMAEKLDGVAKVLITGGAKEEGKSIKQDIQLSLEIKKGVIVHAGVSAKAGKIMDKTKRISFESTQNLNPFFQGKGAKVANLKEPFMLFSHYRNISATKMITTMNRDISVGIASHFIGDVLGTTASPAVYFMAFQDKVMPAYELIGEMVDSKYALFLATQSANAYFDYVKYPGKYTMKADSKDYFAYKAEKDQRGSNALYQEYAIAKMEAMNPQLKFVGRRY